MRILVTGGAGFIGSHVVESYRFHGHEVAVLDNFSTGKRENVPQGVRIFEGSITDATFVRQVFADFQPEVVNHHAAQISVVVSTGEPVRDAELNIMGTINLVLAAKECPCVLKFIYATSGGAMYGNPTELPCTETTPALPISPYGLSKHTAERYLWLLATDASFTATVLRYSNVYGPRQDPHGEAGVCAIFTGRMLEGQPVTIFGDGTQVRDYVYVEDVAEANLAALQLGDGEAFNIATGSGTSTQGVFDTLKSATKYPGDPAYGPERAGEIQEVVLSPAKAETQLGWKAANSFTQGIQKTVQWYRRSA